MMKIRNIFYIGLLFLISTLGYAQQIYRAGNGVTIIAAPTAVTGQSYELDGTNYMVVDNATIEAQVDPPNNNYNIVTTRVTDMSGLFAFNFFFNSDISHWDTSNVTNMNAMFSNARDFNQPLNDWDVSNVTTMELMFQARDGYYSNFNQPLNNWDVSKVTNMRGMFGTYDGAVSYTHLTLPTKA